MDNVDCGNCPNVTAGCHGTCMRSAVHYPAHVFEEDDEPSVDVVLEYYERKLAEAQERAQHSNFTACGA